MRTTDSTSFFNRWQTNKRTYLVFAGLIITLLFFVFFSLITGSSRLGFADLWSTLHANNSSPDESIQYIFWDLRWPRTMAAIAVGAALGLAGFLLQTLLQNPLAEPYTLGLSGGASLGALIPILFSQSASWISLPLGALVGCLLVTFLVIRFTRLGPRILILAGVMISLFCSSVMTIMLIYFEPGELRTSLLWLTGQVGTERDQWYPVLLVVVGAVFFLMNSKAKDLDRLHLGTPIAISLGTQLLKIRKQIIIAVALLTAGSVAISGLVGFVGLMAPHLTFSLSKSVRHRPQMLTSALIGALILLSGDTLVRLLFPDHELPVGSITALFGAPWLVFQLMGRRLGV